MSNLNFDKSKFFEGSIQEYLSWVYRCGERGEQALFSTEGGTPRSEHLLLKIFFRNGVVNTYLGWTQFIEVLYDCGKKGVAVNHVKIGRDFLETYPQFADNQVTVEYFPLFSQTSVQDYIDNLDKVKEARSAYLESLVAPRFSLDEVKGQANRLSAQKFRVWLRKYLLSFNIPYKFKNDVGVQRLLVRLENWLSENNYEY